MAASNPGVALYIFKPNMPFLHFHLNYHKWREVSGSKWREKRKRKSQRMKNPSGSIHGAKEILIFKHHLSRSTWSFFFLCLYTLPQVLPSYLLYQVAKTSRANRKTAWPLIAWEAKCYLKTELWWQSASGSNRRGLDAGDVLPVMIDLELLSVLLQYQCKER